jgi:phosphoadenosine phosphosulfate reductase
MGAIDLHARPSKDFDAKLAHTRVLLQRAATEFTPLKQASSLGAEDVVITHLINALALDIPVFVLETGALHEETLQLLERTRNMSRAPVEVYQPVQESVVQFVGREGKDAMFRSIELRKACCGIRKMEPLSRALAGQKAWITGLRREQSSARAEVPQIDTAEIRTKINPLADWTWGDVWHYIGAFGVDYNPLHDQFFPSIGCAPCTRAISLGEDFRAGRWWWESESAKECGLHVKPHESDSASPIASAQANFAESEVKADQAGRSHDEAAKECGLHVKQEEKAAA